MKKILILILTLGLITVGASAFEIGVTNDPFSHFIEISGPRMESVSGSGGQTVQWSILSSIDKRTSSVSYSILYSAVYSNRSVSRDNLRSFRLPGPIILETVPMATDTNYSRGGNYVHMEIHLADIPLATLLTMQDFQISGSRIRVAGSVPGGYAEALVNKVQEVLETLE